MNKKTSKSLIKEFKKLSENDKHILINLYKDIIDLDWYYEEKKDLRLSNYYYRERILFYSFLYNYEKFKNIINERKKYYTVLSKPLNDKPVKNSRKI